MIKYHIIALFGGFLLDLLVGDPHWMPHPIRLIGSVIAKCSKWNRAELKKGEQFWRGVAMTILVVCLTAVVGDSGGGILAASIRRMYHRRHYDISDSCYKMPESRKHESV